MTFKRTVVAFALLVSLLNAWFNLSAAEDLNVQIVVDKNIKDHVALLETVRAVLSESLPTEKSILLKTTNIDQLSKSTLSGEKTDLLVTVGTVATLEAVKKSFDTPVLSVLIPRVSYETILDGSNDANQTINKNKFAAIFIDQPFTRRFALIKQLLPDTKEVGIVLGPRSANYGGSLRESAAQVGLKLNIEIIENENQLVPALEAVLKSCQVLMAILDPLVFNRSNAQAVLLTSYRYHVPIIGISPAYIDAGALAAVYSTPQQIGIQLAEQLQKFAEGYAGNISEPQYPKYFSVKVNKYIANSLGIKLVKESELQQLLLQGKW